MAFPCSYFLSFWHRPFYILCVASPLTREIYFISFVLFPQRITCLNLQECVINNRTKLQVRFLNCIQTKRNKLKRTLSLIYKLCQLFSVLKECFTIFKGVSKVRNINNMFSLNTVGHVFDEYIKI